jgi:hypothetical protein
VITERLSDGEAQGPVAIASVEAHGLAVRALGVLRAYPDNVSLRLEKVGGATVLVADGQRCTGVSGTPEACERAIRIVPLAENRFLPGPLVDGKGACLGSSSFPVRAKGQAGGPRGTPYDLEASVTFNPDAILIREHLAISRAPRARGAAEPGGESFVSRLQLERPVTVHGGRLVTDGPSLLARWLTQQGAADGRASAR